MSDRNFSKMRFKNVYSFYKHKKNCVNFCLQQRLNTIEKGIRTISRGLQPLIQCFFIIISTNSLGCRVRKRQVMVSYKSKNSTENTQKHHRAQRYCVLYRAGVPERKYMFHRYENCFDKKSNQASIKDGLGGDICNRADDFNHYKKSEHKRKNDLKGLKKQNEIWSW